MAALAAVMCGCAGTDQVRSASQHDDIDLDAGDLELHGLALLTPSSITGREEDRQTIAFYFGRVLEQQRPDIPLMTMAESVGRLNEAGLAVAYQKMLDNYGITGILEQEPLARIGGVTESRFVAMLSLASYDRLTRRRFGIFGLRVIETSSGILRLFLQIWDSQTGRVVWEGSEEISIAFDTIVDKPVTFERLAKTAAENLISNLPTVSQADSASIAVN